MLPARIGFDARRRQVQIVHAALPAHRIKQRVAGDLLLAQQIRNHAAPGHLFHALHFLVQAHGHAVVAQVIRQRLDHLRIRELQQPRPLLHQNHAHAERREHAGVLHPDHAAADHDHRLRNIRHLQHLIAVDDRRVVQRHLRTTPPGAFPSRSQ